jgi:hypothetical protein
MTEAGLTECRAVAEDNIPDPFEGQTVFNIPDEDAAELLGPLLRDESGTVPAPMVTAVAFLDLALETAQPDAPPLEDLVTPESLPNWDLARVRSQLQGYGLASRVRYLSPSWALVLLPRTSATETQVVVEPTPMVGYGMFVRYEDDGRWLVHLVGPPDTPVDELP